MSYDAVIIGSGPNGLSAAITLARLGLSVAIYEAKDTIGGGMRSAELTIPGFTHDICSAIHPLGYASPFFRSLPLADYGLEWVFPEIPLAHPLDDGTAVSLKNSVADTSENLGSDAAAYKQLMNPFVDRWENLLDDVLGPLHFPKHPFLLAHFGFYGIRSAMGLCRSLFTGHRAESLFAGLAAHSVLPLEKPLTAAFGLILGVLGHATGWPFPRGGSQCIANALAAYFKSLGGHIFTGINITSIDQLPSSKLILCDITPRQLLSIAQKDLPCSYQNKLKKYRYGPGVFKIDWALSSPIPWKSEACAKAGTVHLGGSAPEIALSEREVWSGICPEKPYIILAQQSLFDPSRAPLNKQTAWAYCHVPHKCSVNMTAAIESQVERFAPGFKECILARSTMSPGELENYNANYIGGDINGGVQDWSQLFTRPAARIVPYSTPVKGLYLCSSSTPPGGGVHGMCGYHAAQAAFRDWKK